MIKSICRLLFGVVGLLVLTACQGTSQQKDAAREPAPEEPVVEETFEGGDTGTLDPVPEQPTEDEEQPTDDSQ